MAANTNPIFPLTPVAGSAVLTSALAQDDGSDASALLTAGENGTRLDKIILKPRGTNVQTVLRLFLCGTGLNKCIMEQTVAATTADATAALAEYILVPDIVIPSGSSVKCGVGTAVSGGIQVTAFGGDY